MMRFKLLIVVIVLPVVLALQPVNMAHATTSNLSGAAAGRSYPCGATW